MPLLYEDKSPEEKAQMMKWYELRRIVKEQFGKRPDVNAMLFLIGMNELGMVKDEWTKEEKQDLMHVAICSMFTPEGYFEYEGRDEEGWPHFRPTTELPEVPLREQESLLKQKIIHYFEEQGLL